MTPDKDLMRRAILQVMNISTLRKACAPKELTDDEREQFYAYVDKSNTRDVHLWDVFTETVSSLIINKAPATLGIDKKSIPLLLSDAEFAIGNFIDDDDDTEELLYAAFYLQVAWLRKMGFYDIYEEIIKEIEDAKERDAEAQRVASTRDEGEPEESSEEAGA